MYSFYGGKRGISFTISKKYVSIADMIADFALPECQVGIGEYVMIDVNVNGVTAVDQADTGKLYQRGIDGPIYITDLSGPTGKTPIVEVGQVSVPLGSAENDTIKITTSKKFNEDTGDFIGADFNFTIPAINLGFSAETLEPGQEVEVSRVLVGDETELDTAFYPNYVIRIPQGYQGIGIISAEIKESLDYTEQSHLILTFRNPANDQEEQKDLGLLQTIEKIEIDQDSKLKVYYSNNPSKAIELGTLRYVTSFDKENDYSFSGDASEWTSQSGDYGKIYNTFSDTGTEKHYIGTLSSISNIGKVTIPKTGNMNQDGQALKVGFTDGRVVDLGDIRGERGEVGPPVQVKEVYESYEDMVANADPAQGMVAIQDAATGMTIIYLYDTLTQTWVKTSFNGNETNTGTNIIVSAEQPSSVTQNIGDLWLVIES